MTRDAIKLREAFTSYWSWLDLKLCALQRGVIAVLHSALDLAGYDVVGWKSRRQPRQTAELVVKLNPITLKTEART